MKELAGAGIPVTVTCRVLKLSRQPYYRWLANPITPSEVVEAIVRTHYSTRTVMTRSSGTGCGRRGPSRRGGGGLPDGVADLP